MVEHDFDDRETDKNALARLNMIKEVTSEPIRSFLRGQDSVEKTAEVMAWMKKVAAESEKQDMLSHRTHQVEVQIRSVTRQFEVLEHDLGKRLRRLERGVFRRLEKLEVSTKSVEPAFPAGRAASAMPRLKVPWPSTCGSVTVRDEDVVENNTMSSFSLRSSSFIDNDYVFRQESALKIQSWWKMLCAMYKRRNGLVRKSFANVAAQYIERENKDLMDNLQKHLTTGFRHSFRSNTWQPSNANFRGNGRSDGRGMGWMGFDLD